MNNLDKKSEQHQNDVVVNASLHNQSLQADLLSATSPDQILKCEPQQWDIEPDPYSQLNKDLTPNWSLKSDLSTSTLIRHSQEDLSMISEKECNGL